MTTARAIQTLQFQLSKPSSIIGPGLKSAIRLAILALQEKLEEEKGG